MQAMQCQALPCDRSVRWMWELRRVRRLRAVRALSPMPPEVWASARRLRPVRWMRLLRTVLLQVPQPVQAVQATMLRDAMPAAAAVPFKHHVCDAAEEVQAVQMHEAVQLPAVQELPMPALP